MSEHELTRQSEETRASTEPASRDSVAIPPLVTQQDLPPQEVRHADGRIEHPRVSYQAGDISLKGVLIVMTGALCFVAVHYTAAWWFLWDREQDERHAQQSFVALGLRPVDRLPIEPRLEQLDRVAEIETGNGNLRQRADQAFLNSYGLTEEPGFVHVPIARAIDVLVDRLPAREQRSTGHEHDQGLLDAGDSNSGRMFRGQP